MATRYRWVTLVGLGVLIVLGRLRLCPAPVQDDIAAYAVLGHEMTAGGRPLYADLWERKPPLLYLTFAAAERVAGYGRAELAVASTVGAAAVLAGAYAAGGIPAAVLWAVLAADLGTTANQPDPELFINAALTAAVAVLVRWPARTLDVRAGPSSARGFGIPTPLAPDCPREPTPPAEGGQVSSPELTRRSCWTRPVALGALLATATLYKHNAALAGAALLVGHVATSRRRGRAVAEAAVAGAVIVAGWAAVLGHAAAVGRLGVTVDVLFRQNVAYSGGGGGVGRHLLDGLTPDRLAPAIMWVVAGPLALAMTFAFVARSRRRASRQPWHVSRRWGILLAWMVGTWATVAVTGQWAPHYYQLWLPVAAVGGGWAVAGLWPSAAGRVVAAVVLAAVVARQAWQFTLPADEWVRRQFPYYSVANQNQTAARLATILKPGQTFWALGDDNVLYFLTGRRPPSGYLYLDPLLYGGGQAAAWRQLQDQLDAARPAVLLFSSDWDRFVDPRSMPLRPWVVQHYRPWQTWHGSSRVPRGTTVQVWARRAD